MRLRSHRRTALRSAAAALADRLLGVLRAAGARRTRRAAAPSGAPPLSRCCCSGSPVRGWSRKRRETLPDVGLLVVDQTASMQIGDRARLAERRAPRSRRRRQSCPTSNCAPSPCRRAATPAPDCSPPSTGRSPTSRARGSPARSPSPTGRCTTFPTTAARRRAAECADPGQGRGNRPPPPRHRGAPATASSARPSRCASPSRIWASHIRSPAPPA